MKYLFFVMGIVSSACFAQTVRLNVRSYYILDSASGHCLQLHMNANGRVQGAIRVFRLKDDDTLFLFKAHAEKGLVQDTAYWYDDNGTLLRKTSFTSSGERIYTFTPPHHAFPLSGFRHGEGITWKRSQGGYHITSLERYADGRQTGEQAYYFPGGAEEEVYTMENDRKNGTYVSRFPNGVVSTEGRYNQGQKAGKWHYNYEDGSVHREEWYSSSTFADSSREYSVYGKLLARTIHQGKTWDYYEYEEGRLSRTYHTDPYMNGWDTYFYPNGSKKEETPWKDGSREGVFRSWHENGKPWQEFSYAGDSRNGTYTSWYPTGRLKAKGTYRNGEKQNDWKHYMPDGKPLKAPTSEMEWEESEHVSEAEMVVAEPEQMPMQFVSVLPGPVNDDYKTDPYEGELRKEHDLGFLKKRGPVEITATIDRSGFIHYTIVTPMKKSQREKLQTYLYNEFGGRWRILGAGGRNYECMLHMVLELKDAAGSK